MQKEIKTQYMANVTYSGMTYNTLLIVEYEHTGAQYYYTKGKDNWVTEDEEKAKKQKKVQKSNGYYFIKRLAIPTINAKGEKDIWYINNCGDNYKINKISKYGKKIHNKLSENKIINFKF